MQKATLKGKFFRTMLLVTAVVGLATLAIVVVTSIQASSRHLADVQTHIDEGITSKGKVLVENHALALRSMTMDNAFLDMQALVERAVREDGDLVYGIYVSAEGETLARARAGVPTAEGPPPRDAYRALGISESQLSVEKFTALRVQRLGQDVLEVVAPVLGEDDEVLGTIRYGLSTRRMREALARAEAESSARLVQSVLLVGSLVSLTMIVALLLSRIQAGRITRPIAELTVAARELASGNRSVRVGIGFADELDVLGASFNRMVSDLDASYRALEEANRTLEQKVAERTLALEQKNRDMRLLLDNVDQGLVTLNPDGTMALERSRAVSAWFGDVDGPIAFWDYMGRYSPAFGERFRVGWEQVAERFLPVDVGLAQLPERLTRDGRTFAFRYLPFSRGDELEGVLVVIAEITDRIAREHQEAQHGELLRAFEHLVRDRTGFERFLREAGQMVEAIRAGELVHDATLLRRTLHTLKGNAACMGLSLVAELCHRLEGELAEHGEPRPSTLEELAERWAVLSGQIAALGAGRAAMIELTETEYEALVAEVLRLEARDDALLRRVLSLRHEPVETSFRRLGEQATTLARRLHKGELRVEIDGGGVRLEPKLWSPFFSELVHLVRNAVDHGLEPAEARAALGKPPRGRLSFSARRNGDALTFEVADDGSGIDWEAITARAEERALPCRTPAERVHALCEDGITTRSEASDTSGRGVGLSAFRSAVLARGGRLEVHSVRGEGTRWTIHFPHVPEAAGGPRSMRRPSEHPRSSLQEVEHP
ncbi:MAG TPA: ATP-binding protein [Polyangiaceae bacterium]|nr:ATP-binding protein [Polyangiaceae bacterium]